jgi:hypothetical protein
MQNDMFARLQYTAMKVRLGTELDRDLSRTDRSLRSFTTSSGI